jgi:hypothetical protein
MSDDREPKRGSMTIESECSAAERAVLDALASADEIVQIIGSEKIISLRFRTKPHALKFFNATKRWRGVRRKVACDMAIELNEAEKKP